MVADRFQGQAAARTLYSSAAAAERSAIDAVEAERSTTTLARAAAAMRATVAHDDDAFVTSVRRALDSGRFHALLDDWTTDPVMCELLPGASVARQAMATLAMHPRAVDSLNAENLALLRGAWCDLAGACQTLGTSIRKVAEDNLVTALKALTAAEVACERESGGRRPDLMCELPPEIAGALLSIVSDSADIGAPEEPDLDPTARVLVDTRRRVVEASWVVASSSMRAEEYSRR